MTRRVVVALVVLVLATAVSLWVVYALTGYVGAEAEQPQRYDSETRP